MKESKELAKAHWSYIKEVLKVSGEADSVINKIGFHYKTAFIHGYKHAFENIEKAKNE